MQAANFILSIGGSLFAGWALAQFLLRFAPPHLRLLASVAGFCLLAIPLLTLLGLVQSLHATAISVAVGLAVIVLLVAHSKSAGSTQSAWEPKQAPPVATPAWLRGACSGLLVATALPVLRRHLLKPMKFHGDDLSYHATMPAHWLQQQGFFLAPYDYHAYFPASAELFTAFFVAPTLIDTFGALAGLYWMLLAATAAYALARELGVNPALACIAPALMLVSPPFDHQASAYAATDLAAGALACAGSAFLVRVSRSSNPQALRVRASYAGGLFGLAAGCKITFIPLAALALAYLACRSDRSLRKQWLTSLGLFALTCTLAGGYWYLRNLVLTGNPAFPAKVVFFDGPLDHYAQTKTALSTQLALLDGAALSAALDELFDWPRAVFYFLTTGYLLTLGNAGVSLARRQRPSWPTLVIAALGLISLYLVVFGPFSGTANSPAGRLHIRLRFFLAFSLLGIVLAVYWLERIPKVKALVTLLALGCVVALPTSPRSLAAVCVTLGASLGLGWPRLAVGLRRLIARMQLATRMQLIVRKLSKHGTALAAMLSFCLAGALFFHFADKERDDQTTRDRQMKRWLDVEVLPPATRVTWVTTYGNWQYYGMFGRRLQLVPLRVDKDGTAFRPLHLHWRQTRPTWWADRPGRDERNQVTGSQFVRRLQQQGIQAVLLMKRKKEGFPTHYEALKHSPAATLIRKSKGSALFRIAPLEPS